MGIPAYAGNEQITWQQKRLQQVQQRQRQAQKRQQQALQQRQQQAQKLPQQALVRVLRLLLFCRKRTEQLQR